MSKFYKNRVLLFSSIAILLGLLAISGYLYYQRNSSNNDTFVNPKIAVIPFTNLTPNTETNYLGLAFADEVVKSLRLSSDYEIFRGGAPKPNEDLNQLLERQRTKNGVDLVILGEYAISPNEIDVTAKLINTQDKKIVYSNSFTVPNKDIATLPRLVSRRIIAKLGLSGAEAISILVNSQNLDPEAYRLYLKAVDFSNKNKSKEAVESLEKAIQIEPDFYSAWTLKASTYMSLSLEISSDADKIYEKAVEAAQKAKSLDPNNPTAGMLLTEIYTNTGKLEEALKEFKNLPKNDLDKAGKLRLGSYITRYGGLLQESIDFSRASSKLTPKYNIFQPQLYYNGNYEDFKQSIKKAVDEPSFLSFFNGMMGLYENDRAIMQKHFQDSVTFSGDNVLGEVSQAILHHLDGKTNEGLQVLNKIDKVVRSSTYYDGEALYLVVIAYTYLGDKEGAIRAFKKTVENGFFPYPYFVRDPMIDKLRDNQEFQQILETAKQKHLKFKEIYYSETIG